MSLTRSQIDSWNPTMLTDIGDAWIALGAEVEDLFTRYVGSVTKVNDTYWEGKTAEAAQDRANADKQTAIAVIDKLDALAGRAKQGFHEVDAPLRRARMAITGAEAEQFDVSEELLITDPANPGPEPERVTVMREWQRELSDAATGTLNADQAVKDALNAARADLRATFTSAATLGSDQGRSDGAALTSDELTAAGVQRLAEAGELTPEQLDALRSGEVATIPASQMEYLNQVSRSLDGKSPQEIEDLMEKLPPDAQRALANSLQLVSTEDVTASVHGDSEVPTHGGLALLPDEMRESLTREDLVVEDFKMVGASGAFSTELNGVADNQAIARIVASGDDQYQAGSELDRELMDVGRRYLDAQVSHEQNPEHNFEYFTVDGRGAENPAVTEEIFAAVGGDKIAVAEAVVDGEHGQDFVRDMLTHTWTDDGKAASAMFEFDDGAGVVENPNDEADVARATRTGNIMAAVAENMSGNDAWKTLSAIPETGDQSVGQVNPELLRTVSGSMSPYAAELAGWYRPEQPGFDVGEWADPAGNNSYRGAADVFALMNTDEEAGQHFNSRVIDEIAAADDRYAQTSTTPGTTANLTTAGRLTGLMDAGLLQSTQDQYHDTAEQAKAVYEQKSAAYDAAKSLGSFGLGKVGADAVSTMVDVGGNPLKEAIIGKPPGPEPEAVLTGPNYSQHYYNVIAAAPELSPTLQQDYAWILNENGQVKPYDLLLKTRSEPMLEADFREMFNYFGDPGDGHGTAMQEGYNLVVRKNG